MHVFVFFGDWSARPVLLCWRAHDTSVIRRVCHVVRVVTVLSGDLPLRVITITWLQALSLVVSQVMSRRRACIWVDSLLPVRRQSRHPCHTNK